MIYLFDVEDSDHARMLIRVMEVFGNTAIKLVGVEVAMTHRNLVERICSIVDCVSKQDVVLMPWKIEYNLFVDRAITELSEKTHVVTAAGNTQDNIDLYTPSSNQNVITVGALNKSGVPTGFSGRSATREIAWAPGTNIVVDGIPQNGTSVAAAIYAAFLAESIKSNNPGLLNQRLDYLKQRYKTEIESADK